MRAQKAQNLAHHNNMRVLPALAKEGIELRQQGRNYIARCVAHSPDRTPSMVVYPDSGKVHCYACGFHGDAVDIVRALHGFSFREALVYLGIEKGMLEPLKTGEAQERRELLAAFRVWEARKRSRIAEALRRYRYYRATHTGPFTEAELQELATLQLDFEHLEYVYTILCGKDDREKYEIFKEDMKRVD